MSGAGSALQSAQLTSFGRSWAAVPLRIKQFIILLAALLVAAAPGVFWAFRAATYFEDQERAVVKQFLATVSSGVAVQLQSARTENDQNQLAAQLSESIGRYAARRDSGNEGAQSHEEEWHYVIVLPKLPNISVPVEHPLPTNTSPPADDDDKPPSTPPPATEKNPTSPLDDLSQTLSSPIDRFLNPSATFSLPTEGAEKKVNVWHFQPATKDDPRETLTDDVLKSIGTYAIHGGRNDEADPFHNRRRIGIPLVVTSNETEDSSEPLGRGWLIAEPVAASASGSFRSVLFPAIVTVLVTLTVAVLLGRLLQRVVVTPVQRLSTMMGQVAVEGNYTLRVPETRLDEIGQLQTGFNRMIGQVETLTTGLEAQVAARTKELDRTNRELQRSNTDLDRFAYTVSHDLQAPLRNIMLIGQQLREDWSQQLPAEVMRRIEEIDQQCDREMKMVQRILFISRLGRGEIQQQPIDLAALLEQIVAGMRASLEERGVAVEIPTALPTVHGDSILIGEVLRNLLTNAAKYNDKPTKRVRVIGRSFPQHGTTVFAVQDNGIGIRPHHLKKVFDLFTPLHDKRKFSETIGAGMAITRRIVERHHGRIRIVSVFGQGTSFFVRLPTGGVTQNDGSASDSHRGR